MKKWLLLFLALSLLFYSPWAQNKIWTVVQSKLPIQAESFYFSSPFHLTLKNVSWDKIATAKEVELTFSPLSYKIYSLYIKDSSLHLPQEPQNQGSYPDLFIRYFKIQSLKIHYKDKIYSIANTNGRLELENNQLKTAFSLDSYIARLQLNFDNQQISGPFVICKPALDLSLRGDLMVADDIAIKKISGHWAGIKLHGDLQLTQDGTFHPSSLQFKLDDVAKISRDFNQDAEGELVGHLDLGGSISSPQFNLAITSDQLRIYHLTFHEVKAGFHGKWQNILKSW